MVVALVSNWPSKQQSAIAGMHKISIPSNVIDRIKVQRGRVHIFDHLNGPSTALVVIDLQNAYAAPGMPWEAPYAREIVPNVNGIATAVRQKGGR